MMTGSGRQGRGEHPHDDRPAGGAARHVPGRVPLVAVRRPVRLGRGDLDAVDDELLRGIIEGAWRRTAPKAVVEGVRRGGGVTAPAAAPAHTNDTAGARRIAEAFARARAEGRAALIPYVVAGYPDADTRRSRSRARRSTPAPTCSRSGCRTRTRSRTGRRSSARRRPRSRPARRSIASSRSSAGSPPRGPGVPVVADGLREPADRRRRRPRPGARPRGRGRRRRDRRGPHAGRGRAVRGGRRGGGDRRRLPRRADDARPSAAPRSRPGAAGSSTACRWSA